MPWKRVTPTRLVDKYIHDRLGEAMRKLLLTADSGIVNATPVDTGRARGNWTGGINGPGARRDTLDPSGGATIAALTATAAQFRPGDSFYISNNLPYIERLENGWSTQAPKGMVAITLNRLPKRVKL